MIGQYEVKGLGSRRQTCPTALNGFVELIPRAQSDKIVSTLYFYLCGMPHLGSNLFGKNSFLTSTIRTITTHVCSLQLFNNSLNKQSFLRLRKWRRLHK